MKQVIKVVIVGISMWMLTGCAAQMSTQQKTFINPATNRLYTAEMITMRDRTGTEMHHLMVLNDKDEQVDRATASGRGIVAGATDGTVPAAVNGASTLGAAYILKNAFKDNNSTNVSGVSGSDSSASSDPVQFQGGQQQVMSQQMSQEMSQQQLQAQKQLSKNTNTTKVNVDNNIRTNVKTDIRTNVGGRGNGCNN